MITITDKKIKMSAEEYNEFLSSIGGEGKIDKNGIVEIHRDGTLELQEEIDGYLNQHTHYVYDFYRPDNSEDPDWDEIVAKARHFNKKREEDNMKEIIKKLEGEYITVGSNWVKENDEVLYEFLLEQLYMYKNKEANSTNKEDIINFENGDWLVEVYFGPDGMSYCAGPDKQSINNQPPWGQDSWEDWEDEQLELYLIEIKEDDEEA